MNEYLRTLWDLQPLLIRASQIHQAEVSDTRRKAGLERDIDRFDPGTYVVVRYPERAPNKLSSPVRGPFLVKGRITEGEKETDTYIVEDLTSGTPMTFHATRLRSYYHPADPEQLTPFEVASRDKNEYVIDYISDHSGDLKRKKSIDFKVHWFGYDDDEDTWEPYMNVRDTIAFERYCSDPKNGLQKII
jgi:hypothetical protein